MMHVDSGKLIMKIFRWIMVIPSAYVGWYSVLIIGIGFYQLGISFCPENEMDSGICVANWWMIYEKIIFVLFAGLSAMSAVTIPTYVAPSYKYQVAIIAFLIGVILAIWFASIGGLWLELSAAILFGGITLTIILKHIQKSSDIK